MPGPAQRAAPPQGSCCFHWLYSPYATFSEGPGPTSPQRTASSPPFVTCHLAAPNQGRGPGNFQQGQKFATCLASTRNPPWARLLALPLFPYFGQQRRVSLLGRQDTDCTDSQSTLFFYQIYSPDPATFMEHSRSDLLSPIPSLWNTGPHSHGQSPSPALPGGKTRSAQDETPRKPPPGLAVYPGWPGWEEQPSRTGRTHSPPSSRDSPTLH